MIKMIKEIKPHLPNVKVVYIRKQLKDVKVMK